ncbi:hypothetical protein TNIN_239541 [Trichonephila inaurata madagascariensis]|uniref:Uncharacterized protein n=1 Tax=Trichonephila inaurata madagascariensis TaxID=2747483 RepID=A0A8X6XA28_9ARAC|nr:hypothetical protein TNIN_239541 [Trichonephila inaurata madagascariensis]
MLQEILGHELEKKKKVYVRMSSICKRKQRKRCTGTSSRRESSVELYLFDGKGNRYRVCKRMLLNSSCVGEWVIKKWIIHNDDDIPKNVPTNNVKDKRGRQVRRLFFILCRNLNLIIVAKTHPNCIWNHFGHQNLSCIMHIKTISVHEEELNP